MTRKLLHKTSRVYLLFSLLILMFMAPIFYFATEKLYIEDADEALILRKNEFLTYYSTLKESDIPTWNEFNRDIKIRPNSSLKKDTIFYTTYYDTLSAENEPYRELNSPVKIDGNPFTFVARINLVENEDLIKSIASLFFIVIILLLTGLYIITSWLSIKLWKPFYSTLQQIEQFEIDKSSSPRFSKTTTEEFKRLNESIQKLITKNTSIYQNQREFIENAAHELQTPLAIFQAKIDTLIQRTDITEDQSKILGSLNDSVSRLNRLNKNLLLLSKIENDSYSDKKEVVLNHIIEKNLGFFSEQAQAKNLSVTVDQEAILKVRSNPVLVEILISNLFLNAIRHNIMSGKIRISVSTHLLRFSNTGQEKALDQKKLFNRFSRAHSSEKGNGLGLSIVREIADLNKWKIDYQFYHSFHSFSLTIS